MSTVRREGIPLAVYKVLRFPFMVMIRKRRDAEERAMMAEIIDATDIESRFTRIYKLNFWGSKESVSGEGSTLSCTKNLRKQLPLLFQRFSIKTVFDAPCGDFNWMRHVVANCDIDYVGADIVAPLIEENNARYGRPNIRFTHVDITRGPFPEADLWMCRDCLFHLSYEDTRQALERFVDSGIPYLLTTTFENGGSFQNRDIRSGEFRFIDLFSKPYSLPKDVLFRIDDYLGSLHREMCLWSRAQIIDGLERFKVD
jgi:hypothetical protein